MLDISMAMQLLMYHDFVHLAVKAGQRVVGKDGQVYEYVVDPLTGKMYKK